MYRRVNVTLPEEMIRLIDGVVQRGNRSRFIDEAVKSFVKKRRRAGLKRLLKEGALRRAERDVLLAEDWFPLEEARQPRRR